MTRLALSVAVALLSFSSPGNAVQATFGSCSPIVNLNLQDQTALEKFIKERYGDGEDKVINLVVEVSACAQFFEDDEKRLATLLFSLDQMLIVKKKWYIPALDRYIANPTSSNFELMMRMGDRNLRRIEEAIDSLVAYEASLVQIANPDRLSNDRQELARLGENLGARLVEKITGPAILLNDITRSQNRVAMQDYRNRYVAIVNDIEKTVVEMKVRLQQGS
jgi:hypothetical protein